MLNEGLPDLRQAFRFMHEFERDRVDRKESRLFVCRWCSGVYTVFCQNPACRANGKRTIDRKHSYPRELIEGVKADRRNAILRDNERLRARAEAMRRSVREAVLAFRKEHPRRKYVIAQIPVVVTVSPYSSVTYRYDDPFFDPQAPERVVIHPMNIKVNLSTLEYRPSSGVPEITLAGAAVGKDDDEMGV